MPDEVVDASAEIGAFLDKFWGEEVGKVYFATLEGGVRKSFKQFMPKWPLERRKTINTMIAWAGSGKDVFFCPSVFDIDAPLVHRDYVRSVNSHYLDFDGNAPENWEVLSKEKGVPEPSEIVESSVKGQQHAYWLTPRVSGAENLDAHENTSRNLTAAFGTDKAGWDLTQLLRVPYTTNWGFKPSENGGDRKAWWQGEPAKVTIVKDTDAVFTPDVFSSLTNAERAILQRIKITEVPPIAEVLAMGKWTTEMYNHFKMTKDEATASSPENKRSGAVQKLAYFGAENGFTDEQIYAILDDADIRWEKYIVSHKKAGRDKILRDSIARARDKIGYLVGDEITLSGLMGSVHQTLAATPQFVFNYGEFLNAEFHIDWHLEGLLAVGGFGLLVGQPGVGKTRLGIQLGLELAAGRERILTWNNKTGQKKVGFLSLEMSGNALSLFMHSFHKEYQKDEIALSKNFFIAPIGSELPLDKPEGQSVVNNFLSEYKPDILFIDSLQKSVSKPMTDELAMKAFTKFIQDIRKRHNCSVYFVHHERKRSSERTGGFSPGDLSDVYGSQMLSADVDFVVSLAKNGTYVTLDETKNRLSVEQHDRHLVSDGIRFVLNEPNLEAILNHGNDQGPNPGQNPLSF